MAGEENWWSVQTSAA